MAIITERNYQPISTLGDPDDYRPNSAMAFVFDPARSDTGYVRGLTLIFETIAVGDRIPLHVHPTVEEVVVIEEGSAEVRLGDEHRMVGAGAVVFIPPGTPHGTRNVGLTVLRVQAIFPTPDIDIQMLERLPAPGTEGDSPQPGGSVSLRANWS
jgi:mannose-6-phosphate isomerase-like protein (cupin superfamily)